jgi:hypothetical protein
MKKTKTRELISQSRFALDILIQQREMFVMDEEDGLQPTILRKPPPAVNPWSTKCHTTRHLSASSPSLIVPSPLHQPSPQKFLLLQDLTRGMKRPCVLDVKMGTRMYSIHAKSAKVASQSKKARESTSEAMGIRVCGMQVWKDGAFKYMDKYKGRKVQAHEFSDIIRGFLHPNLDLTGLCKRLEEIKELVHTYPNMRLYSSSLLFVYDAAGNTRIDVWMIDFANAVGWDDDSEMDGASYPVEGEGGCDMGYVKGLRSLKNVFSELARE